MPGFVFRCAGCGNDRSLKRESFSLITTVLSVVRVADVIGNEQGMKGFLASVMSPSAV